MEAPLSTSIIAFSCRHCKREHHLGPLELQHPSFWRSMGQRFGFRDDDDDRGRSARKLNWSCAPHSGRIRTHLAAQLEDGETDRNDEREEWQLQSVEGLDAQNAETQRHQNDGLQQDKGQNWNGDFLQFRFARFISWAVLVEFDLQVELIVAKVPGGNGDSGIGHWEIHRHIVAANVLVQIVQNIRLGASTAGGGHHSFDIHIAQSLKEISIDYPQASGSKPRDVPRGSC